MTLSDYAETYLYLAQLYNETGRKESSINLLDEIMSREGLSPDLLSRFAAFRQSIELPDETRETAENQELTNPDSLEMTLKNAQYLSGLAEEYKRIKKYDLSISFYQKSLEMIDAIRLTDHPCYAVYMNNMGLLYQLENNNAEAELYYTKSLNYKRRLGIYHPGYISSLANLAKLFAGSGNYEKAEEYFQELNESLILHLKNVFPYLSEKEKLLFWKSISDNENNFYSFAAEYYRTNPLISREVINFRLFTKGMILKETNKIKKLIQNTDDSGIKKKYVEWLVLRDQFASNYTLTDSNENVNEENLKSLKNRINQLEKELSAESGDLAMEFAREDLSWQSLYEILDVDEAIVEIIKFNFTDEINSTYYLAVIISKQFPDSPRMIVFRDGESMGNEFLSYYQKSIKHRLIDNESYQRFWKNIDSELSNVKRIYFSPDGVYNLINIETLNDGSRFLIENKEIVLLGNPGDLIKNKNNLPSAKNIGEIVLFGSPDFGDSSTVSSQRKLTSVPTNSKMNLFNLSPLPGTYEEIIEIKRLLEENNYKVVDFTEKLASEKNIKKISNPSILHIATHGYFSNHQETSNGSFPSPDYDPLLNSGLIFSHSDSVNDSGKMSNSNIDGNLTAYEVMNLDLGNTGLVVLSACETGKGFIETGEGVYGLQRAFLLAGASTLIMSLWKVDDFATKELMIEFYKNYIESQDPVRSLVKAKLTIKKLYPQPYFWGAFTLIQS